MQPKERLSRLGYVAIRRALPEDLLIYLDHEIVTPVQEHRDVFQFKKLFEDAQTMDPLRRQAPVPAHVAAVLVERLRPIYSTFFPVAEARDWTILKSLPGGPAQANHRDFPVCMKDHFDYWDYTLQPGSILLAVQDGTTIHGFGWNRIVADLSEREDIILNRGDVLLFRGEFVHAGAGYDRVNVRLHCFLEPPGYQRTPNTTEIVAELDPDEIRPPATQCPTCGKSYASRDSMLHHVRTKHGMYQNRRRSTGSDLR